MFPSLLLSLREGLEAALIIGITIAVLNKIKRPDLKPAVWIGATTAVVFQLVGCCIAQLVGGSLRGQGRRDI